MERNREQWIKMGNREKQRTMDRNREQQIETENNGQKWRTTDRNGEQGETELPGMVMGGQDSVAEWSGCVENVNDWFGTWQKGWDRIRVSGDGAGVTEVDLTKFYVTVMFVTHLG